MAGNEGQGSGSVRLASAAGRWVLAVAVLGDAMILLEATVVNVALPTIGRDLAASVAGLQWTLNGYVLTLAALILVGGSLSDTYGRRRMFILGTVVFVAASALCGAAPTIGLLVAARFVQGIGGALLTPGSLAIIDAVFHPDDRAQCHLRPLRSPSLQPNHFEGSRGGRLASRRHAALRQDSHISTGYPIHHFRGRERSLRSAR